MKKIAKIAVYIIVALLVVIGSTLLYVFREQEIDLDMLPNEFKYCGKQIYGNDPDYIKIISWLKQNKDGWRLSYASYVRKHVYDGRHFIVSVLDEMVVVSYKTDYGFPQFTKSGQHGLSKSCQ